MQNRSYACRRGIGWRLWKTRRYWLRSKLIGLEVVLHCCSSRIRLFPPCHGMFTEQCKNAKHSQKQACKARRCDSNLQIWNNQWPTHWPTYWQGLVLGDAIASKNHDLEKYLWAIFQFEYVWTDFLFHLNSSYNRDFIVVCIKYFSAKIYLCNGALEEWHNFQGC